MIERRDEPQAPPLRILLAHDLSAAAELAVSLILHGTWPASSVVRVVSSATGIRPALSSFADVQSARVHAQDARRAIAATHERIAADLREAGLAVETAIVAGKAHDAIIAEADRFGADLIVLGARRRGPVAATLLGSVSRAVVERASCAVIVARSTTTRRLLLATDGSAPARAATRIVETWPLFAASRVRLVGVGDDPPRYAGMVLSADQRHEAYRDTVEDARSRTAAIVDEAVRDLAAGGRVVETEIRLGEPASQVIEAARGWPADIVVVGSSAEPLLHRLLLGTVARKVLDGVASSVLVARAAPTADGQSTGETEP